MSKTVLVVGEPFNRDPQWRIMLEQAETRIHEGCTVLYVYCDGMERTCFGNPQSGCITCGICRLMNAWVLRRFKCRAKIIRMPCVVSPQQTFEYESAADIKMVRYKGVNVGYGALSSYVSWTRDLPNEFDAFKRKYMDYLLENACRCVDSAEILLRQYKPDEVIVFNGRLLEERAYLELSRLTGIKLSVMEVLPQQTTEGLFVNNKITYPGCLPHDVEQNGRMVKWLWSMSAESQQEKQRKGSEFYIKRRNGIPAGDHPFAPGKAEVFTKAQRDGVLPNGFDLAKKNIIVFNSSEDEYAAIDPTFDSFSLAKSQYQGMTMLAKLLKGHPEYHIYLRIHPNLVKIQFPYHVELLKLSERFDNVTVIPAESSCSTYDLMSRADKVVVFGSTMGPEATYWGKPVILIGSSIYGTLDVSYRPKTQEELKKLLFTDDLPPKKQEEAVAYGYFMTNRQYLSEPCKYIDCARMSVRTCVGKQILSTWPKLFGSIKMVRALRARKLYKILDVSRGPKLPLPLFQD